MGAPSALPLPGAGQFAGDCKHNMGGMRPQAAEDCEPRGDWGSGWALCWSDSESGLSQRWGTRAVLRGTVQKWEGSRNGC